MLLLFSRHLIGRPGEEHRALHGNPQHTNTNPGHEKPAGGLSPRVRNGREADEQKVTLDKAKEPCHKSKNLTNIFKPLFPCCSYNTRPGFLSMALPLCCFLLFPPFLIPFLPPEFFSSADLQCAPFNAPLPPSERRPPPPQSVSHSLFLPCSQRQHLPRLPSIFTSVNSVAQRGWLSLMNSLFSLQPGADF